MNNYVIVVIWLAAAELLRRCILSLLCAFTGPLSKVPGPFINKLTTIPWIIENITGNTMNLVPEYHRKYGDVVRVGKSVFLELKFDFDVDVLQLRKKFSLMKRMESTKSSLMMTWSKHQSTDPFNQKEILPT